MTRLRTLALACAVGAVVAWPAEAAAGETVTPRITADITTGATPEQKTMTVRLSDPQSHEPIRGATVSASAKMTVPHAMTFPAWPLTEQSPGTYEARVDFLMPADWTVTISVSGEDLAESTATYRGSSNAPPAALPVAVAEPGRRSLARPWLYPLAALVCVGGVLLLSRVSGRGREPRAADK